MIGGFTGPNDGGPKNFKDMGILIIFVLGLITVCNWLLGCALPHKDVYPPTCITQQVPVTDVTPTGLQVACPDGSVTPLKPPVSAQALACTTKAVPANAAAPNGGSLITCPTSQSLILNGSNGTNGVSPTTVQLCRGTPSYPSTFVEVAFCLNNELYAVYSQNGGFMTLIPPGQYSSNGIGSSCSFTVLSGCRVEN